VDVVLDWVEGLDGLGAESFEPESFEPDSFEPESFEPESLEPDSFEPESDDPALPLVDDDFDDRESVMYQPLPLNTMPTG